MSKKLRCFLKKFTQLTKNLHDRRSRRSRQISSLVIFILECFGELHSCTPKFYEFNKQRPHSFPNRYKSFKHNRQYVWAFTHPYNLIKFKIYVLESTFFHWDVWNSLTQEMNYVLESTCFDWDVWNRIGLLPAPDHHITTKHLRAYIMVSCGLRL